MRMLEKYYDSIKQVMPAMMDELVPMEITPSAKWFLSEDKREFWRYREDFPCVLPPAPLTWMEYQMPSSIKSDVREVRNTTTRAVGAMILTVELKEENRLPIFSADGIMDAFNDMLKRNKISTRGRKSQERFEIIQSYIKQGFVAKWFCFWQLFGEPIGHKEIIPFVSYGFYLDQNGQIMGELGVGDISLPRHMLTSELIDASFSDSLPFLFALSLTHCRNVEMVERTLPPGLTKKRKARDIPELIFRELVIKPVGGKQVISTNPNVKNGMMPLHFVRAHFKVFTGERKLFGKHEGTYFWHQSGRGSRANGEIVKEYKVKP